MLAVADAVHALAQHLSRESDGELKDKFDAAITSMKDDGTLNTMLIKWFGEGTDTY